MLFIAQQEKKLLKSLCGTFFAVVMIHVSQALLACYHYANGWLIYQPAVLRLLFDNIGLLI